MSPASDSPAAQTLFTSVEEESAIGSPKSGILVTNHLNLAYMLSSGLIMPPAGFGHKYYRDALSLAPGWIPLFPGKVLSEAVDLATSEASHLVPCLASVRLDLLSGPVMALRRGWEEIRWPDGCRTDDRAYLLPAPLPANWIERILYRTDAEMSACLTEAREFANVPLASYRREVGKGAFAAALRDSLPASEELPRLEPPLAIAQTAGGIAAALFHVANRGDSAIQACRQAFDPDDRDGSPAGIPVLAPLPDWLRKGAAPQAGPAREGAGGRAGVESSQARVFWELVDRLTAWRGASGSESPEELVAGHLRDASKCPGEQLGRKFAELADALESVAGFGRIGPSDLLKRFTTPFSRAMTLFLVRDSFDGLLDFRHPVLQEADWIAAAVLFGAREGWERLPLVLRQVPGLTESVTHRMAATAHRVARSGVDLGQPPARCRPLREVFSAGSNWRAKETEAAKELARKLGWDCIVTTVHLRTGQYGLRVSREGASLVLQGEPRAVSVEVDRDRFFELMAGARIPADLEESVRNMVSA